MEDDADIGTVVANVTVQCFIVSSIIEKILFHQKWLVVGRKASVFGLSPTMPYPGYATTLKSYL